MPSFQDSAFIILLGLLLFGPKGVAKIARQVGKLVGEFRRASTEFRMQMEDELRMSEHADKQREIAAMQAAAPVAPLIASDIPEPEHPHMPPVGTASAPLSVVMDADGQVLDAQAASPGENRIHEVPKPLPIATSGDLSMMPPPTGLPVGRGASAAATDGGGMFSSVPHTPATVEEREAEAVSNG